MRRLRRRLRLQVSERRPGRAGVRLGASASHRADGSRRLAAAALRLARPRRAVRVHARLPARPPASRASSAARRRCCRWRRSNAASTRCWPRRRFGGLAAIRARNRSRSPICSSRWSNRAAPVTASRSPRRATPPQRGSQVSFAHATDGYAIMQALIARGVIGDFRAPDILRFGFTPLYTRFVDVWDAVDRLQQVLTQRRMARPAIRGPRRRHLAPWRPEQDAPCPSSLKLKPSARCSSPRCAARVSAAYRQSPEPPHPVSGTLHRAAARQTVEAVSRRGKYLTRTVVRRDADHASRHVGLVSRREDRRSIARRRSARSRRVRDVVGPDRAVQRSAPLWLHGPRRRAAGCDDYPALRAMGPEPLSRGLRRRIAGARLHAARRWRSRWRCSISASSPASATSTRAKRCITPACRRCARHRRSRRLPARRRSARAARESIKAVLTSAIKRRESPYRSARFKVYEREGSRARGRDAAERSSGSGRRAARRSTARRVRSDPRSAPALNTRGSWRAQLHFNDRRPGCGREGIIVNKCAGMLAGVSARRASHAARVVASPLRASRNAARRASISLEQSLPRGLDRPARRLPLRARLEESGELLRAESKPDRVAREHHPRQRFLRVAVGRRSGIVVQAARCLARS